LESGGLISLRPSEALSLKFSSALSRLKAIFSRRTSSASGLCDLPRYIVAASCLVIPEIYAPDSAPGKKAAFENARSGLKPCLTHKLKRRFSAPLRGIFRQL
jgi:hypothetical protein